MTRHRRNRVALSLLIGLCAVAPATLAIAAPTPGAVDPLVLESVVVAGRYGVPADAAMVAVNVTVVNPARPGYVTVDACDTIRPSTSNVNYLADQVVPNLVLSRISPDGTICIATLALTDVIVDVVGYVPSGSAITALPAPVRALDTREAGGPTSPVAAGSVTEIPMAGSFGVPGGATTVLVNATAIARTAPGYLTVFPCGSVPDTSSVNFLPGDFVANAAVSGLGGGALCVYSSTAADFVVDIAAYATGGIETLAAPERIVDTRVSGGIRPAGAVLGVPITARADVPDDATAAIYNLTSDGATGLGFATSYPCDVTQPVVSNLNYRAGRPSSNTTITGLAADGEFCVFNSAPTHLVVDLVGYTTGATHYVPVTPVRALDTRESWDTACDVAIVQTQVADGVVGYVAIRAGSDARVLLDIPMLPAGEIIVGPDCTHAYSIDVVADVWETPLDGSPSRLVIDTDLYPVYSSLTGTTDGRVLMLGATQDSTQWVLLDIATGDVLQTIDLGGRGIPELPVLSSDGKRLSYDDGTVKVIDVASGDVLLDRAGLGNAALSPDGTTIAYFFVLGTDVHYQVATLSGDVVWEWVVPVSVIGTPGFSGRMWWAAPGVLVLPKTDFTNAYRAELYRTGITSLNGPGWFTYGPSEFLVDYR